MVSVKANIVGSVPCLLLVYLHVALSTMQPSVDHTCRQQCTSISCDLLVERRGLSGWNSARQSMGTTFTLVLPRNIETERTVTCWASVCRLE